MKIIFQFNFSVSLIYRLTLIFGFFDYIFLIQKIKHFFFCLILICDIFAIFKAIINYMTLI